MRERQVATVRERCLAGLLLAFSLPAQTEPAPTAAPAPAPAPLIRIEARGPAAFRQQLLPTNLGSMLASASGEALWKDVLAAVDAQWQQLHGDAATFAVARRRILDYSGNLHLLGWLLDGKPQAVTLLADPDGRTDLPAAVRDLQQLIAHAAGKAWSKQSVGGRELSLLINESGDRCVLDMLADGRVLLAAGSDAEQIAAAIARTLAAPAAAGRPAGPLFALQVDLAQMVQLASTQQNEARSFGPLGLGSLRTLEFTLQPSGPQVQFELALTCAGDRGLFAGLFPEQAGLPDMMGLAPAGSLGSKTSRFDAMALWRACIGAIAADDKKAAAELEAEARKEIGIDIANDVLMHLSGEALLVWDAPAGDQPDAGDDQPLFTIAVRLRDGKAFAAGFRTLLDKAGMHPEIEDGVLVAGEDQQWFIPPLHFAVKGDLAVMAIGAGGDERALAMLARQQHPTPLPKALAQRERAQPPGCNGAGVLAVDTCLRYHLSPLFALLHELLGEMPRVEPESVKPLLDQFLPLLQQQHLDQLVAFTGTAQGRFVFRLLW